MKKSIYQSSLILNLNSRLFLNALDGVTEEQAKERISDHNNPLNWLTSHTVWARYNICKFLGTSVNNPYDGMFENFKPFDQSVDYKTLAEAKEEWTKATVLLKDALESVSEEHLAAEAPFNKNPAGDFTMGGAIAFLAQHESYDIGQIAFLKKYFTREGMKY